MGKAVLSCKGGEFPVLQSRNARSVGSNPVRTIFVLGEAIAARNLEIVLHGIVAEIFVAKTGHAASIGSKPHAAFTVLQNRVDAVVGQPGFPVINLGLHFSRYVAKDTIITRGRPNSVFRVSVNMCNGNIGSNQVEIIARGGIPHVKPLYHGAVFECSIIPLIHAQPESVLIINVQGRNNKAILNPRPVNSGCLSIANNAQSMSGPKPEIAPGVR